MYKTSAKYNAFSKLCSQVHITDSKLEISLTWVHKAEYIFYVNYGGNFIVKKLYQFALIFFNV